MKQAEDDSTLELPLGLDDELVVEVDLRIAFAVGTSIGDCEPVQKSAKNFQAFTKLLHKNRADSKATAGYICGPLSGRRCAENVTPRRWIALDADRIDPEKLADWRLWLAQYSGCSWPTHTSTAGAPRERALIELDHEVSRAEGIELGRAMQSELQAAFGTAVVLDPSTHRGEQPVFLPPEDITIARFDGEPLRTGKYLADAAALPAAESEFHAPEGDGKVRANRNEHLSNEAYRLRKKGQTIEQLEIVLAAMNQAVCEPPLTDTEVRKIAQRKRIVAADSKPKTSPKPQRTPKVSTVHVVQPLDDLEQFLRRFISYPSDEACVAHILWIVHTHLMGAWESTPRIAFLSPEPGSGKSRALEVTSLLVPRAVEAVNVTPAYLFRKVGGEEGLPTILHDEIDTVFGPRAKDNEEIRGLLNAGHRRSGVAGRCVVRGKQVFTEDIPAYCAVALAGLGGLPDTILSRCVVIRMRRRTPAERVEPFRRRLHEPEGHALRDRIEAWAAQALPGVLNAWPTMPDGVTDRDADVWEALLAVADAAGGAWPDRARVAAVALVAVSKGGSPSLGVRLLADLREVFGSNDFMGTEEIIRALCGLDEAPWSDLRGKPIDARGIATRLKEYGIKSTTGRVAGRTPKGYCRADLHDAWERYLSVPPLAAATSATSATAP